MQAQQRAFRRVEVLARDLNGEETTTALTRVMGIAYGTRYAGFGDRALAEESTARAAVARTLREAAAAVYTDPGHPHGCLFVHTAVSSTPEVAESLRRRRNATHRPSKVG